MPRIAVYTRVSTDEQTTQSQDHAIRAYLASTYPNETPTYFTDHGISGSKDDRPAFQALLAAVAARSFDLVVVYRLDRLSRNASTAIRTILTFDEFNCGFVAIDQPALNLDITMPFRRTLLSAFAEIAQIERETIVSRVRAGVRAAQARGVRFGAPCKVSPALKAQIEAFRAQGVPYRTIAKRLNLAVSTIQNHLKK